MNKKIDKLLKFMAIGCCLSAVALIIVLQLNKTQVQKFINGTNAIAQSYTSTESNSWDVSANEDGSITATLSDDGTLTISGTGDMKDWDFQDAPWYSVKNLIKEIVIEGVTSIGKYAFLNCKNVISVEIPDSITSIGDYAFDYCESLTSIEIPNGVTSIGKYAFGSCKNITSVEIPSSLTIIPNGAFSICSKLTDVRIPDTIISIGDGAFYYCESLTSIEIPNKVTNIGERAFFLCKNLTSIDIPNSVTSIGEEAFYGCKNLTSIEIPNSVTSIGYGAFANCDNLTSIEVDENNTTYQDNNGVLYTKGGTEIITYPAGKKETEYEILSSVTSIWESAFWSCDSLTSIEIPNNVTSIGKSAFWGCGSLTSIEIPNNVTSIGESVFMYCHGLTNIEIPNAVTNIGNYAFSDCDSLTNIYVPSGVTRIGYSAFGRCYSLTSIEVDENNTVYKDNNGVLYSKDGTEIITYPAGKKETEYEILSSVTSIGAYTFNECNNLISIKIPNSVTSIGGRAFYSCYRLTNIEIPNSVTTIGEWAFYGCKIVKMISPENNTIELSNILKRTQDENDILYTSKAFILTNCTIEEDMIKIDEGEPYAKIEINAGKLNGLTYIISYNSWDVSANEDGTIIATLDDNGGLTISGTGTMKDWAYDDVPWYFVRNQIKNVKIENGVTNIGEFAFNDCDTLISVQIPNSVISIGDCAFWNCNNLTSIEVDENNTTYKDNNGVLYSKDGTELITYPAGKEETEYKILSGVTSIADAAFLGCYCLTSIEIPNSVTSIGYASFVWCINLTNIYLPNSVTTIGYDAFYECYSLTLLCYKDSTAATYAQENEINYLIIMDGIQPQTKVQQIKQKIGSSTEYKITDKNGETITDATYVTTGCKIEVSEGENYIIIVEGDTNGDGNADIRDILAINKYRLGKANLEPAYLLASDVNEDGVADIRDILQINKFRLGKTETL